MEPKELEGRLLGLGVSVADRLTVEQQGWFAELVAVGEYGVALEMIADWLSEDELPITAWGRLEANELATTMGNADRVMGPLASCP